MGDGSLSQDEIDALLTGTEDTPASGGAAPTGGAQGSASSFDFLRKELELAMQPAASSASALLGKEIKLTNTAVARVSSNTISSEIQNGGVVVSLTFGSNPALMSLSPQQAKRIAMLIMGAGSEPDKFDEAHFSSIGELASTIFSSLNNSLSGKFSENLRPSQPNVRLFTGVQDIANFPSSNVVRNSFDLSIDGDNFGKLFIFLDEAGPLKWSQRLQPPRVADIGGVSDFTELDQMTDLAGANPSVGVGSSIGGQTMNPVNFPTFQTGGSGESAASLPANYDLILDVQMVLTVELGRTTKYVKDVLKLGEGSIIELDKLAGEPVDLLINGKLIAKGEVVVIDENFGVRVTDIVAPAERLAQIATGV